MNPTLFLEMISSDSDTMKVKNDYERSRSRPTLVKESGSEHKNKCAYQIKINLLFNHDCKAPLKPF